MTAFSISKPYIDIGLYTNAGPAMRAFYGEAIGINYIGVLEIESDFELHRYDANGSVLKIQHISTPMAPATIGCRRILFPRTDIERPVELIDPDGTPVQLVPSGHLDVTQVGIVWSVPSLAVAEAFATSALGAEKLDTGRFRFGESVIIFEENTATPRSGALRAIGLTFITLHVMDVVGAHAHLLANGCEEAIPPTLFRDITSFSFVRDPFGNWIEVSQRADLAGSVAVIDGPALSQDEIRAITQRP